jgi:prepilin-type processing-associated H-X9-DG protein
MEPGRHTGGSNYVFADGHSKWFRFESTINPNNFLWGKSYYPTGQSILDQANGSDIVAVDEAFMIPNVAEVLLDLYKKGKQIYVSSLQLSSEGTAFPEMSKMFPWATKVEVCPAVCFCGNDAYYTITLTEKEEEVTIGGKETYEPRCKEHTNFIGV